jgi:glycosyltransferase involved in cell wall biosynthesis
MNAAGQTVCLNMIVKNEAPVIRRCLNSVLPIVDHWVIVDTGSSDGTQDIIREYLRGVPGVLHERPWRDFAHNRSEALKLARGQNDYTLIIDADDTLDIGQDTTLPALTDDSYTIEIGDTATVYRRPQLVRSVLPWRYEGVLHEYLTCDGSTSSGHLTGIRMRRNHDGARRKDPETYRRDAAVLEGALQTETSPFLISRYRFYLGQSYRDCGEREKALKNYLARAELGFWQEEVFISLYQAGQMKEQLGHPDQDVIDAYLRAADALPTRAEALHGASRFCRYKGRSEEGYQIAKQALPLTEAPAPEGLFVIPWVYHYGLLDEYAVNAYWAGHFQDCLDACANILTRDDLDQETRDRASANLEAARKRLVAAAPHTDTTVQLVAPPTRGARSIGLCMIVKNESHVIARCLDSVRPLIDYVLIEDTGSTDGTQQIIRGWLERAGIPGEVVEEPWHDFAYNRSHVLVRLRELAHIEYALVIDADDQLVVEKGFDPIAFKRSMHHALYDIRIRHGSSSFLRPQLCSNHVPFSFKAILHEYLEAPGGEVSRTLAEGFHVQSGRDGTRNEKPRKYQDDAAVLENALLTETDPFLISRYMFYLGQSYRDCGETAKAIKAYLRRAELGFWDQEVYCSLYEAARLKERLGHDPDEVIALYLRAFDAAPNRAEALHAASRFCRLNDRFRDSYEYALRGLKVPWPSSGLFVEDWIYDFGLLDELAISAYWTERYRECLESCERLLGEGKMPHDMHSRVKRNAEFAANRIQLQSPE